MLESAKNVLAERIEKMPEEALLALLEETFPYVRPFLLCMLCIEAISESMHR